MNISQIMPNVKGREINRFNAITLKKAVSELPQYIVGKNGLIRDDLKQISKKIERCGNTAVVASRKNQNGDTENRVLEMYRCGVHKLCPTCADKVSGDRMRKIDDELKQYWDLAQYAYMITYTVKDGPDLYERVNLLKESYRRFDMMGRDREIVCSFGESSKINGASKSLEIGLGENSEEWHPHIHSIVFTDQKIDYRTYKPEVKAIANMIFQKGEDTEEFKAWMIENNGCLGVYGGVPMSKISEEWHRATGGEGLNVRCDMLWNPKTRPKSFMSMFEKLNGKSEEEIKSSRYLKALKAVKYSLKYSVKPSDYEKMNSGQIFEMLDVLKGTRTIEYAGFLRNGFEGENVPVKLMVKDLWDKSFRDAGTFQERYYTPLVSEVLTCQTEEQYKRSEKKNEKIADSFIIPYRLGYSLVVKYELEKKEYERIAFQKSPYYKYSYSEWEGKLELYAKEYAEKIGESLMCIVPYSFKESQRINALEELRGWCEGADINTVLVDIEADRKRDEIKKENLRIEQFKKENPYCMDMVRVAREIMDVSNPWDKTEKMYNDALELYNQNYCDSEKEVPEDVLLENKGDGYSVFKFRYGAEYIGDAIPEDVALWQLGADLHREFQRGVAKQVGQYRSMRSALFQMCKDEDISEKIYVEEVIKEKQKLKHRCKMLKGERDFKINKRSDGLYNELIEFGRLRRMVKGEKNIVDIPEFDRYKFTDEQKRILSGMYAEQMELFDGYKGAKVKRKKTEPVNLFDMRSCNSSESGYLVARWKRFWIESLGSSYKGSKQCV